MEPERARGDGSPQGVILPGQALLHSGGELLVSDGGMGSTVAEMLPCLAERPGDMVHSEAEMEPCLVELPPCHEEPGASLGELPPCMVKRLPRTAEMPEEQLRLVSRGTCLVHNWQEERATNQLDEAPCAKLGSEGFVYRHGHRGLLTLQCCLPLATSTTMQDSYHRPQSTRVPVRGQRAAILELMLYQNYRKETLAELYPPAGPMESRSTTHRDYRKEGFQAVLLPHTRPHDYHREQPRTFWLESARQLTFLLLQGVSNFRSGETPFRRNATFTTPVSEYLGQPLPCAPENHPTL
ncbi:sperm-associated antigen 8 isoform X2 [Carettochelys insculpta]|uniref:sperm-associated antigen 8 isoform X2 n=1 Tax=Carettochelys insculpta TaxID=44489 RepID=UPI003EBC3306